MVTSQQAGIICNFRRYQVHDLIMNLISSEVTDYAIYFRTGGWKMVGVRKRWRRKTIQLQ